MSIYPERIIRKRLPAYGKQFDVPLPPATSVASEARVCGVVEGS